MEEKYKIHSFYILLILGSIIVGLISVKWAEIPKLVDYITFALTVSSLGLALLAIIYSMYSNTTFSQNISTLESSTSTLTSTSTQLSIATDELKSKVENIPGIIQSVGAKVEETHALVNDLKLRSAQESVGTSSERVNIEESNEISETVLSNFLTNSSFNGLLILYIYCLSYRTNTPFSYKDLLELGGLDEDYSFGYSIALGAANLIDFENKKGIWSIKGVNNYLDSNISNKIDEKITKILEELDDDNFKLDLTIKKKQVEEYFE